MAGQGETFGRPCHLMRYAHEINFQDNLQVNLELFRSICTFTDQFKGLATLKPDTGCQGNWMKSTQDSWLHAQPPPLQVKADHFLDPQKKIKL
jgi:hypothetical protein